MATPTERADATSIALRRPPIRQATTVRSDLAHTFSVFVREIGTWWPTRTLSAGGEQVRAVTVETHLGGRVYETWHDDTTVEWGRLLVWDPPHRFTMSWTCTPAPTEVELTFTVLGPALTRVAVEHRGWEALSEAQIREDCALPGGYAAGAFNTGWTRILDALTRAAETDTKEPA